LLGNERLISQLKTAVAEERIAHAYLLVGAVGSGKKTLAGIMSRMFLCRTGGCGTCSDCNKLELGVHPDLVELHGEKSQGAYSIDQIRKLRKDALIYPNEAGKKVYILHEADKIRGEAQDAFLKILEEPPAFVVFILLCNDESKMLATVLSRVVRLAPELPDPAVTMAWLREQTGEGDALLQTAIGVAGGNPGQALSLISEGTLSKRLDLCEKFCKTLLVGTPYDLSAMSHALASDKAEFAAFLRMFSLYLRDILVYKTTRGTGDLIFGESITANGQSYARIRTQGIPKTIEEIGRLATFATQPISILLIEMRLVTLVKEELI